MTKNKAALLCGVLFGLGLAISQMNNPDKVLAFLDVTGNWDASLAFVMAGALITLATLQHFILKRSQPVCDTEFHLPKVNNPIDKRLILGAIIFGIGWGLVGFCPGAVLAAWGDGKIEPFLFTFALGGGMMLFSWLHDTK
ncbi:MAG: YeeE/YedE thiosulfate transporter family protein [Methylococcales bacterium]|nr:YeeE/YedE thiosulfate transporter family protein [Methylococcales bacterium]MDD5753682.1 YeeE/YedE thiosulfate transporter family protein [Methylococcales bacterium]